MRLNRTGRGWRQSFWIAAEAFWLWAGKVLGGWCDGIAAYCRARQ